MGNEQKNSKSKNKKKYQKPKLRDLELTKLYPIDADAFVCVFVCGSCGSCTTSG